MAKKSGKESFITGGGIESSVEGFDGNITTSCSFKPTYGDHKKIGSDMAPVTSKGRGAGEKMRSSLMTGGRGGGK